MFDFLKKILKTPPPQFTGALLDNRPDSEKANDVHFSEIVGSANAVNWQEKWPTKVRQFPAYDQKASSTCGANALSKSEGIHFSLKYGYLPFSRPDIYQRRYNRPAEGMAMYDMFDIASKYLVPTSFTKENPALLLTESDFDSLPIDPWAKELTVFSVKGSVKLPADIEAIASVIQTTQKAPVILTYFTAAEWSREIPVILQSGMSVNDSIALRHFSTIVDFTLFQGKKYLVVEDSAWFGGFNRRLLSAEWIAARGYEIRYGMNFKFEPGGTKPSYDGMTIISAQRCLQFLGYFPSNVAFAENIGAVTRGALTKFQAANGLPQTAALDTATKNLLVTMFP